MHQNNSQLYSKKKPKLCFCVWIRMTWLEFLNLLFPLKYHPTALERQFNYLKCFSKMSLWQSNDLSAMLCHQSFLLQCLLSTYWKLLPFLESIWNFFYDFWAIEYLISLFNSKAASREHLIIFIALIVSSTANWRAWPWQCVKWVCESVSFICVATPVLAPIMLDASSWH